MRKQAYRYIILTALFVGTLLAGCTRNDGDIGTKFGLWKLTSMTIDGAENPCYERNIFWGFQNTALSFRTVKYVEGIPEYNEVFVDCREADGYLILNTDFYDNQGTFRYTPPAVLLLPAQTADIHLKILSKSSSRMELEYIAANGSRILYYLRKWG